MEPVIISMVTASIAIVTAITMLLKKSLHSIRKTTRVRDDRLEELLLQIEEARAVRDMAEAELVEARALHDRVLARAERLKRLQDVTSEIQVLLDRGKQAEENRKAEKEAK